MVQWKLDDWIQQKNHGEYTSLMHSQHLSFPLLCHQRKICSFLSMTDKRFRDWAEFIKKTSPCIISSTASAKPKKTISRFCLNPVFLQYSCQNDDTDKNKSALNSNQGSNPGFILGVSNQSLSCERVCWKSATVLCEVCLPLEGLTYAYITRWDHSTLVVPWLIIYLIMHNSILKTKMLTTNKSNWSLQTDFIFLWIIYIQIWQTIQ